MSEFINKTDISSKDYSGSVQFPVKEKIIIDPTKQDDPHDTSIQQKLVQLLTVKNKKIATAESLTGGLLSKKITEVSGASLVFECGICSYSNRIKHELLGVSTDTLERFTEYSSDTAAEMAQGVRRISGADIGISTTGIAGPGGGTPDKPVGLVYVGISTKHLTEVYQLLITNADGDRELIREVSASFILSKAVDCLDSLS